VLKSVDALKRESDSLGIRFLFCYRAEGVASSQPRACVKEKYSTQTISVSLYYSSILLP